MADVLIVGNGILGLSLAVELARRSPELSVATIGPAERPGAATPAAGAMLGCFGEVTKHTLASTAGRAKFALARDAATRWPQWLDSLNEAVPAGVTPVAIESGTTVILNARGGRLDSENFAALRRALVEFDEPHEELLEDQIHGLDALDDARPLLALHIGGEGRVDARRMLGLLAEVAGLSGVTNHDAAVEDILIAGDRAVGVRLGDGTVLSAGVVVLAAGAFTGELLERVAPSGTVMPIVAGSGVGVEVRRVLGEGFNDVVRTVNRAGSCGLHVVPLGGGTEYVGATNVIFRKPETAEHLGVCHFLIQAAIDQLDHNLAFARVATWRVGNRPVSLDGYPVAGWSGTAGLYILSGTYRDGFQGAPSYAASAADELLGSVASFDPHFIPTRPFTVVASVEESISEFSHEAVASWFESGLTLPRFNHPRELQTMFASKAREMYDRIGINFGLPADILTFLVLTRKHEADVAWARQALRRYTT